MGILGGRHCEDSVEEQLRALEDSSNLKIQVLAQNLRCEIRMSPGRHKKLIQEVLSGAVSDTRIFGAFEQHLRRSVRVRSGAPPYTEPPDYLQPNLNGNLMAHGLPPSWPAVEYRQFLDITRQFAHAPRNEVVNSFLDEYGGSDGHSKPTSETFFRLFKMLPHGEITRWIDRFLSVFEEYPEKKDPWGPAWVTPLLTLGPDYEIEEHLARLGLGIGPSYWIELRFDRFDFMGHNLGLAAPSALDTAYHFWHPAVPSDPITYAGSKPNMAFGYTVDLREHPEAGSEPLPELICMEVPSLWRAAWRNAGKNVFAADPAKWQKVCGFAPDTIDQATLEHRRVRHSQFLAWGAGEVGWQVGL